MMRKPVLHYSAIQCLYWINFAIVSGNASVYLTSQKLDEVWIGTVLAVSGIISAFLQPVLASVAQRDRRSGLHRTILAMLGLFVTSAAAVLLFYGGNGTPTAVAWCLCMLMMQSIQPLINTLAVLTDVPFSAPRAAGSIGYAVVFFALGQLVPHTGTRILPIDMIVTYAVLILVILFYPRPEAGRAASPQAEARRRDRRPFLMRHPELGLVVLGSTGLYFSHMAINAFALQIIRTKGGGEPEMGIAGAIAAILELPVMFGFSRINRHCSARAMMRVTGIFFMLKSLFTLLSPDIACYYLTQVLQMPAFALATVASVQYIRETVPLSDAVKGQSCYGMAVTVGSVLGSQVGGLIIKTRGVNDMLLTATLVAAVGTAVIFAALSGKASRSAA